MGRGRTTFFDKAQNLKTNFVAEFANWKSMSGRSPFGQNNIVSGQGIAKTSVSTIFSEAVVHRILFPEGLITSIFAF